MAHKKSGGGKASQHKRVAGKRLGLKKYGGERVLSGNIILRQRGSGFHAGENVGLGRDFTLYALKEGLVNFRIKQGKRVIDVLPVPA